MGANHIVQRLYMRNVPATAQHGGGLGGGTLPPPPTAAAAAALLQQQMYELGVLPGSSSTAQKRRAEDSLGAGGDGDGAKRARVRVDVDSPEWLDRAEIFDRADTMYAMEYLKNGDVCLPPHPKLPRVSDGDDCGLWTVDCGDDFC